MSRDARHSIKLVLLVSIGVAMVVALAWWSVVGMAFVVLAALLGLCIGWTLGYHSCVAELEQHKPQSAHRRTTARPRGRGKR